MIRTFRNDNEVINFLREYVAFEPGGYHYDETMAVHYLAAILQNMAERTWNADLAGQYVNVLSPEAQDVLLLWADAVRWRGEES